MRSGSSSAGGWMSGACLRTEFFMPKRRNISVTNQWPRLAATL
jgi:hypothetical protein